MLGRVEHREHARLGGRDTRDERTHVGQLRRAAHDGGRGPQGLAQCLGLGAHPRQLGVGADDLREPHAQLGDVVLERQPLRQPERGFRLREHSLALYGECTKTACPHKGK